MTAHDVARGPVPHEVAHETVLLDGSLKAAKILVADGSRVDVVVNDAGPLNLDYLALLEVLLRFLS